MAGKKRCHICKKPYLYELRWGIRHGQRYCVHDTSRTPDRTQFTQGEQKRVLDQLGRHEVAVKDHEGNIHILQRTGTSSNRPAIRER